MAIISLALLAACAGPTHTTFPDGTVAQPIDCGGSSIGLNYCFEKAGKSCGADGYSIITPDGRVIPSSEIASGDVQSLTVAYSTDTTSILIKCGS